MKRSLVLIISVLILALFASQLLTASPVSAGGEVPTGTPQAIVTPVSTRTGAPSGTAAPAQTSAPTRYALVNVPDRGTLNIRSGPSTWYPIVSALAAQQIDPPLTGKITGDHPRIWYEVRRTGGGLGWISGHYVTEYVTPEAFCKDDRTKTLISDLAKAVTAKDGKILASIASANHGITLRLYRNAPPFNFFTYLTNLFDADYGLVWGKAPGAYKSDYGTFGKVVTPKLQDVFGSQYETSCNDASKIAKADFWPPEYSTINFITVYKPESKAGAGDWRAWLVGVDYVNGKPGVFALIHYQP